MSEQLVPPGRATTEYLDQVDIDGDRELVDRFQLGDDTAFAELYSRHHRRLFRTCLRCLGDPASAEDAAQEAFAKALRALPTLNGDRRFYPWLSVIAKRVCVDIHRQRARSRPAESIDPGATADGEQAVLTSMDAAAVQDALGRLTSRHRDVLHLREYEGWSYRRIASHYGVRLAAVETLLWRARRALHRQLTMAGYERRALVSLPVAGWAYRRVASIRARIEEWGGHRLAPVVGSAASVITIGALVIGTTGSGAHASRPQPLIAAHAPTAATPLPPPPAATSLPSVTVPSVPSVPTASASLPAAPRVPPTAGQAAAAGRAAVLGATFTNASAASQQAGQAPVHASVAGVAAGVNPKATASGLASTPAATVDQLRRSIP
jgi:RNA polymerase sigma-70 factor (ECF subfamily)